MVDVKMMNATDALLSSFLSHDVDAIGAVLISLWLCICSGRFDEIIVFGGVSLVYSALITAKLPELGMEDKLQRLSFSKQTDLVRWIRRELNVPPSLVDPDLETILIGLAIVIATLLSAILVKRSLSRYSPALSVVFYVACVSLLFRDRLIENPQIDAVVVSCMVALTWTSKYILRLHTAASLFCGYLVVESAVHRKEELDFTHVGPFGVTFCLVVGFGACVVHDVFVNFLLRPIFDVLHLIYILLATFVSVDVVLEILQKSQILGTKWMSTPNNRLFLGSLTWSDSLNRTAFMLKQIDHLQNMPKLVSYETIVIIAAPFCVLFATTMTMRSFLSPSIKFRKDRFKEALGVAFGACFGLGLCIFTVDNERLGEISTSPVVLTLVSALVYLQISRFTEWKRMSHSTTATPYDLFKDESIVKTKNDPYLEGLNRFTMIYWNPNAFFQRHGSIMDADDPFSGENGGRSLGNHFNGDQPPFVISGKEDPQIKQIVARLNRHKTKYERAYQDAHKLAKSLKEEPENQDFLLSFATARTRSAENSALAALDAEKVALRLRELAGDAETEREVLRNAHSHTTQERKRHDHYMVIKRQMNNANSNFNWLKKEMENGENESERLFEIARREAKLACKAVSRAIEILGTENENTKELVQIIQSIDPQIIDPNFLRNSLKRAKHLGSSSSASAMNNRRLPSSSSINNVIDGSNRNISSGNHQQLGVVAGSPPGLGKSKKKSPTRLGKIDSKRNGTNSFRSQSSQGNNTTVSEDTSSNPSLSESQRKKSRLKKLWPFARKKKTGSTTTTTTAAKLATNSNTNQ